MFRAVARAAAGIAGLVAVLFGLWGTLWVLFAGAVSIAVPDPSIPDGDPCCGHPDTWGEVAEGVAWTLGAALVDSLIFAAAAALICYSGLRPPAERAWSLAAIPAAGVLITGGLMGYALAGVLGIGPGII